MKVNLCLKCQEKAVYHRKYSGEKLCPNCFNNSLIEKTRKTISKYKMINYGDNSIAKKELEWNPGDIFKDITTWLQKKD